MNNIPVEQIKSLYREMPKHGLIDLAGMDDLVEEVKMQAYTDNKSAIDCGLKIGEARSVMLYGPVGSAKTYITEALVHDLMTEHDGALPTYLRLNGSDILSPYVGMAEKIIATAFQEAIDHAPAILVIENVDNFFPAGYEGKLGYPRSLVNAFLESYNNLVASKSQVLVLTTTSHPWNIDSDFLNHLTGKVYIPLPSKKDREIAFRNRFGQIHLHEDLSFAYMADGTELFDFRELNQLCDRIAMEFKNKIFAAVMDEKLSMHELDHGVAEALQNGEIKLDKAVYDIARSSFVPFHTVEEIQRFKNFRDGVVE